MARPVKPLTSIQIKNAKPAEKPYKLFDGGGLFLQVNATGSKFWKMKFSLNEKEDSLSFGKYPGISLQQAREKREEARKMIANGINPKAARKEQKRQRQEAEKTKAIDAENTFQKIASRLYASKAGRTTEAYRNKMLREFEIHLFPVIGNKHIKDITGGELTSIFQGIAKKTNKEGKPMTYMAKKLCRWTSEVYDLANTENSQQELPNPCRRIVKFLPKHKTKNAVQIPQDQLGKFLRTVDSYGGYITSVAIQILLYTGMRQISIRRATWADFDLGKAIWHRKPEKDDPKIHDVPLPKQALLLLKSLQVFNGNDKDDLLFQSSLKDTKKPISENTISNAIIKMGFHADGHGLRGTVTTGLNEMGFEPRLVEAQIGHANGNSVESAYNKARYFKQRKEMMQKWADHLDNLKNNDIERKPRKLIFVDASQAA